MGWTSLGPKYWESWRKTEKVEEKIRELKRKKTDKVEEKLRKLKKNWENWGKTEKVEENW